MLRLLLMELGIAYQLFNITRLDLYDLKIVGNGHILARELGSWSQIIPNRIAKAVREVALEFVRDSVKEIDELIYSQPAPENYQRTKRLRKGHKIKKVGGDTYLVGNYVPYAIRQHDGWTDRGGHYHSGRPWMDVAMANNHKKYEQIIDKATTGLWRR